MTAQELISELVGPHFGVIEEIERVAAEPDDPEIAVFAARLASTAAFSYPEVPRIASGAAWQAEAAAAACLGEAVERYAAGLPPPGAIVCSPLDQLDGPAIAPDQFALFSSRQYRLPRDRFPFVQWRPNDPIGWTRAQLLLSQATTTVQGESVWLPAVFVWLPYEPLPGEPLLAPCLSTGVACGADRQFAVFAGLCEVIERDALALAWLGKHTPPRIELPLPLAHEPLQWIVDECRRVGLQWNLFDLTTDLGVPVVSALVEGHSSLGWIVSAGSACHPDPLQAMCKALTEATHCRMYVKSLLREQPQWRAGRHFCNVTGFAEHARFYTTHPEFGRPLDRWRRAHSIAAWSGEHRTSRRDSNHHATTGNILQLLEARGYQSYCVDVTTPDVCDVGLSVVRVVVPGLQPIHGNHAWRHLGGPRLQQLPQVFGRGVRGARRPLTWNRFPHPWA